MGPFIISLFVALGAGTWIYSQLQQRTGYGNSQAIIGAALAAAGIFTIVYLTMRLFGL